MNINEILIDHGWIPTYNTSDITNIHYSHAALIFPLNVSEKDAFIIHRSMIDIMENIDDLEVVYH